MLGLPFRKACSCLGVNIGLARKKTTITRTRVMSCELVYSINFDTERFFPPNETISARQV